MRQRLKQTLSRLKALIKRKQLDRDLEDESHNTCACIAKSKSTANSSMQTGNGE